MDIDGLFGDGNAVTVEDVDFFLKRCAKKERKIGAFSESDRCAQDAVRGENAFRNEKAVSEFGARGKRETVCFAEAP